MTDCYFISLCVKPRTVKTVLFVKKSYYCTNHWDPNGQAKAKVIQLTWYCSYNMLIRDYSRAEYIDEVTIIVVLNTLMR